MTKEELSKLLHSLEIPVGEGISSEADAGKLPRVLYHVYIERDEVASGEEYVNLATYQVDIFAKTPQHLKYRELREKLRKMRIHPQFYHEYVENDPVFSKTWHTYFAIEVTEEIDG